MKRKNKLILVLCCIPILVSCLVLPLCSFTTSNIGDSSVPSVSYDPLMDVVLGYQYHRLTNTLDLMYDGELYNPNRVVSGFNDPDSIEFFACDYLVSGTKSFDYLSTTHKSLPSSYEYFNNGYSIVSKVCMESDDSSSHWFTGRVEFDGLVRHEDIDEYTEVAFYTDEYNLIDWGYYTVEIYIEGIYFDDETGTFLSFEDSVTTNMYDQPIGSNGGISLRNAVVYYEMMLEYDVIYINHITLEVDSPDPSLADVGFPVVAIYDLLYYSRNSKLMNSLNDMLGSGYYHYYQQGFDDGFELGGSAGWHEGYNVGKNAGVSSISAVWSSLGDFLEASVGSFFDFELWQGFTLGTLMSIFVGAMLLIGFLKIFAGG